MKTFYHLLSMLILLSSVSAQTEPASAQTTDRPPAGLHPSPPRPTMTEQDSETVAWTQLANAADRGIDNPGPLLGASPKGNFNLLVIMVDFSDNVGTVTPASINQLVFGASSSVKHYYSEISYGSLNFVTLNPPSNWYRASRPYNGSNGYVNPDGISGTSDDFGWGNYPQNLQGIVADVLPLVDGLIDFSDYDNNNDGFVDAVLFTYAGPGAEIYTPPARPDPNRIWSSAWNMTDGNGPGPLLTQDGVWVDHFTFDAEYMNAPYDQTIGIYCHEIGHAIFGLPDLYDYDGSSAGIGAWSLMGYGSWNGPGGSWNGSSPAWPDAWSRALMGFETPTILYGNVLSYAFQPVETLGGAGTGNVVRLQSHRLGAQEYFLIEYRDNTVSSYDSALPGSGLLIWHVDEEKWNAWELNRYECTVTPCCGSQCPIFHPLLALEQADGLRDLEYFNNYGDAGDPFALPTQIFAYNTNPDSGSYLASPCPSDACIEMRNLVVWPQLIFADLRVNCTQTSACLDITLSEPTGWALAGEEAPYEVIVRNCSSAFEPAATLFANIVWPFTFFDLSSGQPIPYPPAAAIAAGGAWRLGLKINVPTYEARGMVIGFTLNVTGSMGGADTQQGTTRVPECILLVDDDRKMPDVEDVYQNALQHNQLHYDYWDMFLSGPPDGVALSTHEMVIWFTGAARLETLTPRQEIALANYLDGGGNLFVSSQDYLYDVGRSDLNAVYLHIRDYTDDIPSTTSIQGVPGNPVGGGIPLFPLNPYTPYTDWLVELPPATPAFQSLPVPFPNALTYDNGTSKVLFLAWPLENLPQPGADLVMAAAAAWMGVPPFPQTAFTVSPELACSTQPLTFTNTSQHATQFLWNFGDGITSTLTDTVHTFTVTELQTYTVSLRGENCCGFSFYFQAIPVHPQPMASFQASATVVKVGETVVFTNTSQNAASYLWEFGDGVTSTLPSPSHVYTHAMTAIVILTAANECNTSVFTSTITIEAEETPVFTTHLPLIMRPVQSGEQSSHPFIVLPIAGVGLAAITGGRQLIRWRRK